MRYGYLDDHRVDIAEYTDDMYGKLTCGEGHPIIAKRGTVKIHHFAHRTKVECSCHDNKGEWHIAWQDRAKEEAQEIRIVTEDKVHIADTLVGQYVIEYQHSPMDVRIMRQRESFYTGMGYILVWVFDVSKWMYKHVRKIRNELTIRKSTGSDFPLNASYTGNVIKILDFGKSELFLVTKQHGTTLTGQVLTMEDFDARYLDTMCIEDPDTRWDRHPL